MAAGGRPSAYLSRTRHARGGAPVQRRGSSLEPLSRPNLHLATRNPAHSSQPMAFLRVLQHPGKLQLSTKKSTRCIPIEETKDKSDGVVTYSITYKHMDDIAAFCQFERHMSSLSAKGALRPEGARRGSWWRTRPRRQHLRRLPSVKPVAAPRESAFWAA